MSKESKNSLLDVAYKVKEKFVTSSELKNFQNPFFKTNWKQKVNKN